MSALPAFAFDEVLHEYSLGGRVIPGVTEILRDAGVLKYGTAGSELESVLSMARGKAVHAACQYLDEGTLEWGTVQDEALPYVVAYEKFKSETGFKPLRIEERLFHETFGFAGTLDREGTWDVGKGHVLVDLKTGAPAAWWALQLAGYDLLLPTLARPRERFALQLKDDGTYAAHPYRDPNDRNLFIALVSLFNWKRNHGG